jgi:hypothetical protein
MLVLAPSQSQKERRVVDFSQVMEAAAIVLVPWIAGRQRKSRAAESPPLAMEPERREVQAAFLTMGDAMCPPH